MPLARSVDDIFGDPIRSRSTALDSNYILELKECQK